MVMIMAMVRMMAMVMIRAMVMIMAMMAMMAMVRMMAMMVIQKTERPSYPQCPSVHILRLAECRIAGSAFHRYLVSEPANTFFQRSFFCQHGQPWVGQMTRDNRHIGGVFYAFTHQQNLAS